MSGRCVQSVTSPGGAVTFRDTKAGGREPYSAAAIELCRHPVGALPRLVGNPYVFIGRVHGAHLQEPSKAWHRVRTAAGLEHLRIHALRRTFGSWLGDADFTSKQMGTALGHKSDITSRVYMPLGDQSKRAAVDAVERLIHGLAKEKPGMRMVEWWPE